MQSRDTESESKEGKLNMISRLYVLYAFKIYLTSATVGNKHRQSDRARGPEGCEAITIEPKVYLSKRLSCAEAPG